MYISFGSLFLTNAGIKSVNNGRNWVSVNMELSNLFFFFFSPYKSKSVLKFGLAEAVSSDRALA